MGKSTCIDAMRFACVMVKRFGDEYLSEQNMEDIKKLFVMRASRGFLGKLGSTIAHIGDERTTQ